MPPRKTRSQKPKSKSLGVLAAARAQGLQLAIDGAQIVYKMGELLQELRDSGDYKLAKAKNGKPYPDVIAYAVGELGLLSDSARVALRSAELFERDEAASMTLAELQGLALVKPRERVRALMTSRRGETSTTLLEWASTHPVVPRDLLVVQMQKVAE